jgi:hypothetical protein
MWLAGWLQWTKWSGQGRLFKMIRTVHLLVLAALASSALAAAVHVDEEPSLPGIFSRLSHRLRGLFAGLVDALTERSLYETVCSLCPDASTRFSPLADSFAADDITSGALSTFFCSLFAAATASIVKFMRGGPGDTKTEQLARRVILASLCVMCLSAAVLVCGVYFREALVSVATGCATLAFFVAWYLIVMKAFAIGQLYLQ